MSEQQADNVPDWDQLQVQLAGCLCAAEGHAFCEQGAYGWSPAGQAVVDLRHQRDTCEAKLRKALQTTLDYEGAWMEYKSMISAALAALLGDKQEPEA